MLSDRSVSGTLRRDALYCSLAIHACALLVWFLLVGDSVVRFDLTVVHAGSPEPVRNPHPIYSPVRIVRPSPEVPSDHAAFIPSETAPTLVSRTEADDDDDAYTPTEIPSGLLKLIGTDIGTEPGPGIALAGIRTITPLIPPDEMPLPPPPDPPPGQPDIQPPIVIGGRVEQAVLVEQSMPVYPHMARTARVEGTVVLEGTITVKGKVVEIAVVSGHPMLIDAAINAVKRWKYRPAKLNGQLTPVPVTVQVRFTLQYPEGR